MTNYSVHSVSDYINTAPEVARAHLTLIRKTVESALPTFEKEIGYGKPYYKYKGWVIGFDVYKHHVGIEIWDGLTEHDKRELEDHGYKTGNVSFQVRFDQPVPVKILKKLVAAQISRNENKTNPT